MGLGTAFRAFFASFGSGPRATRIREILDQPEGEVKLERGLPAPQIERVVEKPARSDALTLLSALQREARMVDLIKESLDAFSDAQVGAAARPCLKQCAQVIDRMFELQPITQVAEGGSIPLPSGYSPIRYQTVGDGKFTEQGMVRVVHPGWEAKVCQLPQWTGDKQDSFIIAPIQVEAAN